MLQDTNCVRPLYFYVPAINIQKRNRTRIASRKIKYFGIHVEQEKYKSCTQKTASFSLQKSTDLNKWAHSGPQTGRTPMDSTGFPTSSHLAFSQKEINGSSFIRKCKGHRIANEKKNKVGGLSPQLQDVWLSDSIPDSVFLAMEQKWPSTNKPW